MWIIFFFLHNTCIKRGGNAMIRLLDNIRWVTNFVQFLYLKTNIIRTPETVCHLGKWVQTSTMKQSFQEISQLHHYSIMALFCLAPWSYHIAGHEGKEKENPSLQLGVLVLLAAWEESPVLHLVSENLFLKAWNWSMLLCLFLKMTFFYFVFHLD
jgi:hypothetical protein